MTTPVATPIAGEAQTFPRLANYSIGGSHDYFEPAIIAHAALDDVYVFATWNGWQATRPMTMPQVVAAIAAQSTRYTRTISYFDAISTQNAWAAFLAQMNSANFWLRTGWPYGSIQQFYGGGNVANVYPGGPTGVGGRDYGQYVADYSMDWMFNGGAAGLATDGTDAVNDGLSGVYQDDMYLVRPAVGDWARTGAFDSGTDAQMRVGLLSILQRMKASKPGILTFANASNVQDFRNTWTEYVGQFDGGVLENMVGSTNSIEQVGSDSAYGVLAYQNQMTLLNSNNYGVFVAYHITANGQDQINSTTPYQAMRHAFAFCLVVGNARCAFESPGSDPANSAALWFDEESVNLATRSPYTSPDASAAPGLGYLGAAVDPPQTGPYQDGYWRRRFQNGEVWWSPREARAGTIYFGRTVNFINGAQAPDFNTGGSGTTHAINSRDGIIVLY